MAGVARSFGSIAVALVTAGALGFVLLGLVSRWLTKADNAAFLTVWGTLFALGSVISASEQEISRQATRARLGGDRTPASALQQSILALALTGIGLVVIAVLPWSRPLVHSSIAVAAVIGLAIIGFTGQFLVRGLLLGSGRSGTYAGVIASEALVRIIVLLALIAVTSGTVVLALAATAAGCFGWVFAARRAFHGLEPTAGFEPWPVAAQRLGLLAASNFLSSLILTGFPALVTLVIGSPAGLATLFGAITLSRLPLVALSPVQTLTVPMVVTMLHEGKASRLARLQWVLAATACTAAVAAGAVGFWLGPWALRLFLGSGYSASGFMIGLLLATSCLVAAALLQLAAFVALERYKFVVLAWAAAVASALASLAWLPGSPEQRGTMAFVTASIVVFVLSGLLLQLAVRRHREVGREDQPVGSE